MEKENQLVKKLSEMKSSDSKELLKSLIHDALSDNDSEKVNLTTKEKLARLKECRDSLNIQYNFKSGDIIKWKKNLKNRVLPEYDEPVIVLEVLENPIYDNGEETASTYFKEPLDMIVGYIADEGELISFYYDSRRFQPFKTK